MGLQGEPPAGMLHDVVDAGAEDGAVLFGVARVERLQVKPWPPSVSPKGE